MTTLRRMTALSLMTLVASAGTVMAESPAAEDLAVVEQDMAVSAQRQQELALAAETAVKAQDELSNRLVALGETVTGQERELRLAEKHQNKLKSEIAAINLDLASKQDVIAEVLAGLQRLEHNPPPALLVAPDDVLDALRGAMVFGAIVPELRHMAQKLHDQLAELKTLRETLDIEIKQHDEALKALNASRTEINALIAEKKALALSSQQELESERKRAEELAAKATSLKQLLADLAAEKAKAEARLTAEAKARAEAEKRLQEASLQPEMAFSKAKGQIKYPADGKIVGTFHQDSTIGGRLDGIVIATAKQAQVISPVTGKVEFSGKFRSYGQLTIINPGEGYLVLLAGMDQVVATHGQSVKAGEPVGTMGEKPGQIATSNGFSNLTTPVLYVEFRKNGDPVDPTPWWIGIRQEAMR
jgi:murein hydrolase activator